MNLQGTRVCKTGMAYGIPACSPAQRQTVTVRPALTFFQDSSYVLTLRTPAVVTQRRGAVRGRAGACRSSAPASLGCWSAVGPAIAFGAQQTSCAHGIAFSVAMLHSASRDAIVPGQRQRLLR